MYQWAETDTLIISNILKFKQQTIESFKIAQQTLRTLNFVNNGSTYTKFSGKESRNKLGWVCLKIHFNFKNYFTVKIKFCCDITIIIIIIS